MSAKIILARGDKANKTGGLSYGELFWQKTGTGELGTLYVGKPDGSTGADLAIGGARAMESLFYKGTLGATDSLPLVAGLGDFYIFTADSASLVDYKATDWAVNVGVGQWARVNNSGGSAADTLYTDSHDIGATTVQTAIDTLAATRLQYAGTFDPSTHVYPSNPKDGEFYLATAIGTITLGSVAYKQGDAALYVNGIWQQMPLSLTFPADGIEGSGQASYVAKFDSQYHIVKSSITDNGTTVEIHNPLVVDGSVTGDSLILNSYSTSGDLTGKTTIEPAVGAGNLVINMPATGGTLQLVGADIPASDITYINNGTGTSAVSLVSTNIQDAITELAQGKMAYAGTISTAAYPATPVIGGLYLLTADVTIGGTVYEKGDYAFYDPTYAGVVGGWTQIAAGYSHAADIAFDPTGLKLGDATTAVSSADTTTQLALADLFAHKADLVGGHIPIEQLPAAVVGGLSYKGTYDASTGVVPATAATANKGWYYVIDTAGTIGGVSYTVGDWIVSDGSAWENIQGGGAVDAITVGSTHLQGDVTFAASGAITVTPSTGTVTIGVDTATKLAKGVVQVGGGLAVDTGIISVDAYKGLTIDSTSKKLMLYLNNNGLEIDSNSKVGIKAGSAFTFPASGGDAGKLVLADISGLSAGTYTKVGVNAQGQVTSGATLLVADLPITAANTSNATEIYNSTTGVIADLSVVGPVGISKVADNIILDFTQLNATTLSAGFAVATPTDFTWNTRATGSTTISSIVGAVNANREDLNQYITLLRTKGTSAGSLLIGTKGIGGVTPTGGALSGNATLQAMLEGLAAYTNSQISAAAPNITGTPYQHVMFNGAGNAVVNSAIKQNDASSIVTVDAKLSVGEAGAATELDIYGPTKFFNAAGTMATTFMAPTGVAGQGLIATTQYMPDQDGQLLNSNSTVDGGIY